MTADRSPFTVIRHADRLPSSLRGAVVAMGNFDGVHAGHRHVIALARARAVERGAPCLVVTFEPHPRQVFRRDDPPFRLTPFRDKIAALASLGVDGALVLRFDRALAALTAEAFVDRVLIGALDVAGVVVGRDFCFGRERSGDVSFLAARLGDRAEVIAVADLATPDGRRHSSTAIRQALIDGAPDRAAALLGRPFRVSGRVRRGDQRGRLLGFPTANMRLDGYIRPARGVYAVAVEVDGPGGPVAAKGVANLGNRPTVGGHEDRLETHLFDYAGDLYGRRLSVDLIAFIRPERKFDSLDALKAQIATDSLTARDLLNR